jgi:hypothetical protein
VSPPPPSNFGRKSPRHSTNTPDKIRFRHSLADDVTIFVTRPEDFHTIQQAISTYERTTGVTLNVHKSKAMAIENWTQPPTLLGIGFHPQLKILGITFAPTITQSVQASWPGTIQKVRQQARITYDRTLCLTQRIHMYKCAFWQKYGT